MTLWFQVKISLSDFLSKSKGVGDVSVILGELNSCVRLKLRSKETGSEYEIEVKRHVELQSWNQERMRTILLCLSSPSFSACPVIFCDLGQVLKWYEVRDEYKGQDLCADPQIVDALAAIRASVVDRAGDFVDLLGGSAAAAMRTNGTELPAFASAAIAATAGREPQNGHGITFAFEVGQGTKPSMVHHIATGSPAHILECIRFGDEVIARDALGREEERARAV